MRRIVKSMRSRNELASSTPTGPAPTMMNVRISRRHEPSVETDAHHFGLQEVKARRRGRIAQRIRDRVRRKLTGRDLVEERREQVVVLAVDDRDVGLAGSQQALELANEMEAREPTAEHDDALGLGQFGRASPASAR